MTTSTSLRPFGAFLLVLFAWAGTVAQMTAPAGAPHAFDPALRDTAADPCTDFYQYACGGWLRNHPVPPDHPTYGRDTEAQDADEKALRIILERAAAGGTERTTNQQKIGDAYAACIDTTAIEAAGTRPLADQLLPIANLKTKKDLPELLGALHKGGVDVFFGFGPQPDARNATQEIAAVRQPRLGLPEKGYYERLDGASAQVREEYTQHIRRSFALLGASSGDAARDADTVVRVERELAGASLSEEELRDPTALYHKTPLAQFEANSPQLDFARYLKAAGAPAVGSLNVAEPLYFLSLEDVLGDTSLDDLRVFLRWTVIRAAEPTALPRALDDESFLFYGQQLAGTPQQQPRWQRCAQTVDSQLGEALGAVYVAERFPPENKQRTEEITRAVEAAAARDLDRLPWMSEETRAEAERKLRLVANKVGYPDHWRDYSGLRVASNDAWGNAERAAAWRVARDTRKIGRPVDRSEWTMTPPTVNAYYDPQTNSINFPAGILQPPYFDPTQDDAANFGSVGAVIGHELTHGFDDEGRRFDGQGNLRDWWRKDDAQHFNERAACVEGEYDGFTAVDALHVNGKLTLGENLADLAGLELAWQAYQAQPVKDPSEGGLTPAQQFFTAYGQSWCANTQPEYMRERVRVDPHAPEKYRVNGVLQNMPAFAEAWQCKPGAAMVAAKRCTLW